MYSSKAEIYFNNTLCCACVVSMFIQHLWRNVMTLFAAQPLLARIILLTEMRYYSNTHLADPQMVALV
jgi:hypothetical protein